MNRVEATVSNILGGNVVSEVQFSQAPRKPVYVVPPSDAEPTVASTFSAGKDVRPEQPFQA